MLMHLAHPRPTRTARRLLTPSMVAVTRTANGTTGSLSGSTTPLTTQQSAATRLARAARRKPWSSRNEEMTRKRTAMTKQLVTSRTVSMYLLLPMPTTPSAVDRSPDGAHVKCGHSHLYRPLTPSSHYSKPCVPRVGSAGGEAARLGRPLGGIVENSHASTALPAADCTPDHQRGRPRRGGGGRATFGTAPRRGSARGPRPRRPL